MEVINQSSVSKLNAMLQQKNKPVIIFLYMDGCHHCSAMENDWENLIPKCKKLIPIVKVNSMVKDKLLLNLDNVFGYPTVLAAENGNVIATHNGERSTADLLKFAKSHAKVPKKLSNIKACNSSKKSKIVCVKKGSKAPPMRMKNKVGRTWRRRNLRHRRRTKRHVGGACKKIEVKWTPAKTTIWDKHAKQIMIPEDIAKTLKEHLGSRIPVEDAKGEYWVVGRDCKGNYIPKRDTLADSESMSIARRRSSSN